MSGKGDFWWILPIAIWSTIIASSGVGILVWAIILPIALFYKYSSHKKREKINHAGGDYKPALKQSLAADWSYRSMMYNFIPIGCFCIIFIVFLISNPQSLEKARITSAEESSAESEAKSLAVSFLLFNGCSDIKITSVDKSAGGIYEIKGKGIQIRGGEYLRGAHEVKYKLLVNLQTGNVEILK